MPASILQHLLIVGKRHVHRRRQFDFARRPAMLLFEARDGFLDTAEIAAQAARQPVVLAHAVEHGTTDALRGVGLELCAEAGFKAADGVQQAHHAVLHQIVDLDTGRQPGHQVIGDTLDQWREALDQLIFVNLTSSVVHVRKNQA